MNNNKYNITQYDFQEYSETLEKTVQLVKSKTVLGSSLLKSESNINIQQRSTTYINQLHLYIDQFLLLPPPCTLHWGIVWPLQPRVEDSAKQLNKINGFGTL